MILHDHCIISDFKHDFKREDIFSYDMHYYNDKISIYFITSMDYTNYTIVEANMDSFKTYTSNLIFPLEYLYFTSDERKNFFHNRVNDAFKEYEKNKDFDFFQSAVSSLSDYFRGLENNYTPDTEYSIIQKGLYKNVMHYFLQIKVAFDIYGVFFLTENEYMKWKLKNVL